MKSSRIDVRCNVEEKLAWEAKAAQAGKSLSEWLRELANRATGLEPPEGQKLLPPRPEELCTTCFVKGYANCERCKGLARVGLMKGQGNGQD